MTETAEEDAAMKGMKRMAMGGTTRRMMKLTEGEGPSTEDEEAAMKGNLKKGMKGMDGRMEGWMGGTLMKKRKGRRRDRGGGRDRGRKTEAEQKKKEDEKKKEKLTEHEEYRKKHWGQGLTPGTRGRLGDMPCPTPSLFDHRYDAEDRNFKQLPRFASGEYKKEKGQKVYLDCYEASAIIMDHYRFSKASLLYAFHQASQDKAVIIDPNGEALTVCAEKLDDDQETKKGVTRYWILVRIEGETHWLPLQEEEWSPHQYHQWEAYFDQFGGCNYYEA